jgi:hypothetical protein
MAAALFVSACLSLLFSSLLPILAFLAVDGAMIASTLFSVYRGPHRTEDAPLYRRGTMHGGD